MEILSYLPNSIGIDTQSCFDIDTKEQFYSYCVTDCFVLKLAPEVTLYFKTVNLIKSNLITIRHS